MPINMAFTYAGLSAMKIDETVLASFPEAFKEGMAARARRLHDTGPSAPENWDGELGLDSVHGYFSGGSENATPAAEAYWKALRADVAAFNDRVSERGELLRMWIGLLFRFIGLEIVHIELGQEPYEVANGERRPLKHRTEHFGFRDGVSQPFVDMGLGDTLPGGGTPGRNGSWTPVAPGEIFLDQPDEDGEPHRSPIAEALRVGSTFLVFRKLEQDVQGFRDFLKTQRPGDTPAQDLLAAQIVGRWKNGTPLALSPTSELKIDDEAEAELNNFRYRDQDGNGQRCPLSAHIRRANPRDIGKPGEVRHHRILRRGMSYGGPLLPEGSLDAEKRGLLFIAANARIDLQFEVIQANWLNGGEFLGQAGLDRCPLMGANDGVTSTFLAPGAAAPMTPLPRFVITRGGDYFFAPGLSVLRSMTNPEQHFKMPYSKLVRHAFSMAEAGTPALFDAARQQAFGARLLAGAPPIRAQLPPQPDGLRETVVFVGLHSDVRTVLRSVVQPDGENVNFSTRPYHQAGRRLTDGETLILGADLAGPTRSDRERLTPVLNLAWDALATGLTAPDDSQQQQTVEAALRDIARTELETALRRAASGRHIDLVSDLAVQAAYGVIVRLFGAPGPSRLAGMAATPSSAPRHIGDLPRDWISALQGEREADPGLTTMQAWAAVLAADLVGNVQNQQMLQMAARRAAAEMLRHIEHLLADALASDVTTPRTLIQAFVHNESLAAIRALYPRDPATPGARWTDQYYEDVAVILLEIVSTTLVAVPIAFASVMTAVLKYRIDLGTLLPQLRRGGLARLIYEAERLEPFLARRMRQCEADTVLARKAESAKLQKGDFIVALVAAANKDPRVFKEPNRFSLAPYGPTDGPQRMWKDYLMFGVKGSEKACWGRNRVAMPLLEECVLASSRLRGLRKVAGPGGQPKTLVGLTIGLTARFTAIASAEFPKPEQSTKPPRRSSNRSAAARRDPLLSEDHLAR
jgi:Dyp-type peroxidase family